MKKKIICCIGDSLTQGDYGVFGKTGIANVQEKNYPYFLSQLTGCEVKNFGHCGFQSVDILNLFNSHLIDVTGANIIIIILGTNGGQTPEGGSENDLAYYKILNLCKKQAPDAYIFICTPPHATVDPKKSNFGYYDRVKDAADFVKKVSSENKYPLIDLFNDKHFTSENEDIMQPNDGLHFSEIGYRTLAEIIYSHIKHLLS